jgi:hypothetical protein
VLVQRIQFPMEFGNRRLTGGQVIIHSQWTPPDITGSWTPNFHSYYCDPRLSVFSHFCLNANQMGLSSLPAPYYNMDPENSC